MNLYVWNDPYHIEYGGSCAYVVAEDEDAARLLAKRARISRFGGASEDGGLFMAALFNGPPSRILSIPCAEVYEWCE